MKKSRLFLFHGAVFLIFALVFAFSAPAQAAPTKFVVADAQTTHHLNLYVAKELGIFEKHGLDVTIESVSDNAAARDLVVSGGADIFWSCPTVAIAAIANGAPLKTIAQVKRPCTSVLLVEPDSPIKTFADLKDKEIAGISPTCEAVISLTVKAIEAGGNFNLQKLAGGPAIAALKSKNVDGAILEEPHVSIAELEGYKVIFPDVSAKIPCRTINVSDRVLAASTEELKIFIEAVDEADKIIIANPIAPNIVDIAVKYTGAPKEAIIHGNDRLKFTIALDTAGLKQLGDELVKLENIKENPGDKLFAEAFKGITW
jgi:NitT/TauT family transport system substrate-binding protein